MFRGQKNDFITIQPANALYVLRQGLVHVLSMDY